MNSKEHEVAYNHIPKIDIEEFCQEYIDWIDHTNILLKEGGLFKSEGTFNSNLWILLDEVSRHHLNLDFSQFDLSIKKASLTFEDVCIVKCWLANSIKEHYSCGTIERMFNSIRTIILLTDNFNLDTMNNTNGDIFSSLINNKNNSYTNFNYYICQYINFLDSINLVNDGHLLVLEKLRSVKMYEKYGSRILPKSKDIFAFQYYLNKFFTEETNEYIKNFYFPLLLWWKITNVIPMRPSEFCYKLKRDCISMNNDEYYLHIGRVKVSIPSTQRNEGRIPLLSKVKITKEIYQLIFKYIELTSFDTYTKTLVSYKAMLEFKKEFYKNQNKHKLYFKMKKYNDVFTRRDLENLLKSFYKVIIEDKYKDNSIEKKLNPGDTRHLAFMSLLLQGVSPIEIAMLGGHTTLESQSSYTSHIEYYIDSEILNFVGNLNIETSHSTKNLKEIVFNNPFLCPKMTSSCSPTEDGIGYCTLDSDNANEKCDNVEHCLFCSNWWCEPTNDNYIKAKHYIENNSVNPLKQVVVEEQKFLMNLLAEAKVMNIDGLLELEKESETSIKQATLKLKSDADKIIFYSKSLQDMFGKNPMQIGE